MARGERMNDGESENIPETAQLTKRPPVFRLCLKPGHPVCRETRGEAAPDAWRTLDIELRLVATERMLDDSQTQTSPAGIT